MNSMNDLREGKTPSPVEARLRALLDSRGAKIVTIEAKSPRWVRAVVEFPGKGTQVVTADIVDRPLSDGHNVSFTGSQLEAMKEAGSDMHVMFASRGTDAFVVMTRDVFAHADRDELWNRGGSC